MELDLYSRKVLEMNPLHPAYAGGYYLLLAIHSYMDIQNS